MGLLLCSIFVAVVCHLAAADVFLADVPAAVGAHSVDVPVQLALMASPPAERSDLAVVGVSLAAALVDVPMAHPNLAAADVLSAVVPVILSVVHFDPAAADVSLAAVPAAFLAVLPGLAAAGVSLAVVLHYLMTLLAVGVLLADEELLPHCLLRLPLPQYPLHHPNMIHHHTLLPNHHTLCGLLALMPEVRQLLSIQSR